MPRYGYGGYNDPSSMMQASGGLPGYNPYSKNFQWGTAFSGLKDVVQQILAIQQMKEQQKREAEEKEWRRGTEEYTMYLQGQREQREKEKFQFEQEQARIKTQAEKALEVSRHREAAPKVGTGEWTLGEAKEYGRTGQRPESRPVLTPAQKAWAKKTYGYQDIDFYRGNISTDQLKAIVKGWEELYVPEKETKEKPSDYDKRSAAAQAAFKRGEITAQQLQKVMMGLTEPEEPAGQKGAATRASNQTRIGSFYSNNPWAMESKEIRKRTFKDKKTQKYTRPIGGPDIALDMPDYYNVAKANESDGAATERDKAIIQKAEYTADKFFKELIDMKPTKEELVRLFGGDPKVDLNVLIKLAEIYK